jgi:hypothetical protein
MTKAQSLFFYTLFAFKLRRDKTIIFTIKQLIIFPTKLIKYLTFENMLLCVNCDFVVGTLSIYTNTPKLVLPFSLICLPPATPAPQLAPTLYTHAYSKLNINATLSNNKKKSLI